MIDVGQPFLIDARGLSKKFNDLTVVNNLDLQIAPGEIYGLVGPDGAGKTTTLRMLCGALKATRGQIKIAGYDLDQKVEEARLVTGYLSQRFSLYEDLTVLENIRFFAEVRSIPRSEWHVRSMEILKFVGLDRFISRKAGDLSGGMKQKLGLSTALVHRPQVLLLDEPTTGVDPITRQDFWQLIIQLAAVDKIALLVTTPYMDEAARCHRVGFMQQGRLLVEDTPGNLRSRLEDQIVEIRFPAPDGSSQTGKHSSDYAYTHALHAIPILLNCPWVLGAHAFGNSLHVQVAPVPGESDMRTRMAGWLVEQGLPNALVNMVPAQLEDVFISLAGSSSAPQVISNSEAKAGQPLIPKGGGKSSSLQKPLRAPGKLDQWGDDPIIQVNGLTRRFGTFTAVDHVQFSVSPGEIVGYLGPNGCGKTTTIRMLLGLLRPTEGTARVLGYDISQSPEAIRAQTGYMSQKFGLYQEMTVLENLAFYAGVYGMQSSKQLESVLELTGLLDARNQRVQELSTGWRQRLALGTAIVHQPQLLFLDEPTSGIDPVARRQFWNLIYTLANEGVTIFVTTHYMDEANYCGRVGIMQSGKLLALDTTDALKRGVIEGATWEIHLTQVMPGLDALKNQPGVQRVFLSSDYLSVATLPGVDQEDIQQLLVNAGLTWTRIARTEPTLEDVFLALAEKR